MEVGFLFYLYTLVIIVVSVVVSVYVGFLFGILSERSAWNDLIKDGILKRPMSRRL